MRDLVAKLWRFGLWLAFKTNAYWIYSRFIWILTEREFDHVQLARYADLQSLSAGMRKLSWMADRYVDHIASPHRVEAAIQGYNVGDCSIDCDDHSFYAGCCLYEMHNRLHGMIGKSVKMTAPPQMLSVVWQPHGSLMIQGHNVCVFQYEDTGMAMFGVISNWNAANALLGFLSMQAVINYVYGGYHEDFIGAVAHDIKFDFDSAQWSISAKTFY